MDRLLTIERPLAPKEAGKVKAAAKASKEALAGTETDEHVTLLPNYTFTLLSRYDSQKLSKVPKYHLKGLAEDETIGIVHEALRQVPDALSDLPFPVRTAGFLTVRTAVFVTYHLEASQAMKERAEIKKTLDNLNDSTYSSWGAFYPQLPVAILSFEKGDPQEQVYRNEIFEEFNKHRPAEINLLAPKLEFT
ncbi:MAG TPA: hypothetical protein VIJ68_01280 [Candidatus Saccharimonadales bacterium]